MHNMELIRSEIDQLKQLLEHVAEQHKYNFKHPEVLDVSQKLDNLIIQQMKQKYK